jgi:hypothetical protein
MKIKTTPLALNTLRKLKRITNDPRSFEKIYRIDGKDLVLFIAKTLYNLGLYPPEMTLTELAAELNERYPYVAIFLQAAIKRLRQLLDKNPKLIQTTNDLL